MDQIGRLFTLFVILMLSRGILQTVLGGGKAKRPRQPYPEGDTEPGQEAEDGFPSGAPKQESGFPEGEKVKREEPDFVADFERRLKKNSDSGKDAAYEGYNSGAGGRDTRKEVHRDDELHHDTKGRIHKEEDALSLGKSPVYKETEAAGEASENICHDPMDLKSVIGRTTGAGVAAVSSVGRRQANRPEGEQARFKRRELARGFIIGQLLGKPRSLKPYGSGEAR